jgi:hypothetical protein
MAQTWLEKGLLEAASGEKRIRSYWIGQDYANVKLEDLGSLVKGTNKEFIVWICFAV